MFYWLLMLANIVLGLSSLANGNTVPAIFSLGVAALMTFVCIATSTSRY